MFVALDLGIGNTKANVCSVDERRRSLNIWRAEGARSVKGRFASFARWAGLLAAGEGEYTAESFLSAGKRFSIGRDLLPRGETRATILRRIATRPKATTESGGRGRGGKGR